MPNTFYIPMPRSPSTELADDIDHLETSIPVLNTDIFPDPPNLATIGSGHMTRQHLDAGTVTAAAASTLTDDTQTWDDNEWQGQVLRIINGTGAGQRRIISANNADTITVTVPWNIEPDATSDYDIVSMIVTPNSETVRYTNIAIGALTGVTRGYEPEHSSRAWPGGTIVSRVLTAQDIRALQNRVITAEGDIVNLNLASSDHEARVGDLETDNDALMRWYRTHRIWGIA
jgi:hypothetical protein